MPNIFEYTDFRKYLSDYYEAQKTTKPAFSYQYFAQRAGFKNKGFVFNVINGQKNLSSNSIYKISKAIGHSKSEVEYFEALVCMNQAKEHEVRAHFYAKLENIKNQGKKTSPIQIVRKDQYEFYSKWYHSVIRSLINNYLFKDDYKWLAKNIHPAITPSQAKKSVALLERMGLIKKQAGGFYGVTNKTITTGKEVMSLAVANFHLEMLALAAKSIKELPRDKRNITGLTLGISKTTYDKICAKTQEFQTEILEMAEKDDKADRVYQFDFALFPLTILEIKGRIK